MGNSLMVPAPSKNIFKKLLHSLTFGGVRDASKIEKIEKEFSHIIEDLGTIKEFEVLTVEEFKYYLQEDIYNNLEVTDKGFIIMGDINNLYAVNKYSGKGVANKGLKEIISNLKSELDEVNAKYKIAKLGNEIYIHSNGISEDKVQKLKNGFNNIRVSDSLLFISVGFGKVTDDPANDIIVAKEDMEKQKAEIRMREVDKLTGGKPETIVSNIVAKHLEKLSINLNRIKDSHKDEELKVDNFNVEEMVDKGLDTKVKDTEDTTYSRIDKYKSELQKQFPVTALKKEFVDKYIISRLLSEDKSGKTTHNQLILMKYKDIKGFNQKNKFQNMQVMSIELTGKKWIDDKYGSDACEEMLKAYINGFEKMLEKMWIDTHGIGIVKRNLTSYYCFVDKIDKTQLEAIKAKSLELNSKFGMSIAIADLVVENGKDSESFKQGLVKALSENEKTVNEEEIECKIDNLEMLEAYIVENIREISEHPVVQNEIKKDQKCLAQIKNEVMSSLNVILTKNKEKGKKAKSDKKPKSNKKTKDSKKQKNDNKPKDDKNKKKTDKKKS